MEDKMSDPFWFDERDKVRDIPEELLELPTQVQALWYSRRIVGVWQEWANALREGEYSVQDTRGLVRAEASISLEAMVNIQFEEMKEKGLWESLEINAQTEPINMEVYEQRGIKAVRGITLRTIVIAPKIIVEQYWIKNGWRIIRTREIKQDYKIGTILKYKVI
jgi:hypothetical protein